jgi:hypothetical protein
MNLIGGICLMIDFSVHVRHFPTTFQVFKVFAKVIINFFMPDEMHLSIFLLFLLSGEI